MKSCAMVAAAIAVISLESYDGETSTMSIPTMSMLASPADGFESLGAAQPTSDRRAGTWGEGGVEAVDVEGQVGLVVGDDFVHDIEYRRDPLLGGPREPPRW